MEARDAYAHLLNAYDQLEEALMPPDDSTGTYNLISKARQNILKVMDAIAQEIAEKAKKR